MAGAGNRLQINLVAQDDISQTIKQTKANIRSLKADVVDLARRQERGEEGVQDQLEATRRDLVRNQRELVEMGRRSAALKRDYKGLGDEAVDSSRRASRAFDAVSRKLGLTGEKADVVRSKLERLDDNADEFSRKWSRAFDKVDAKSTQASRSMDRAGGKGGFLAAGVGKVAGAAAAAAAAIGALTGAFAFLGDSINEARGARLAAAQMANVMRSMGRTESPKAIRRMVADLEELSGIDGDNILEMTNVLFTFGNVTGDTFEKANALALDVSVAFGKDLQSSAVMVGKALNDPAKGLSALTRIGVQFSDQQQSQVKAMMAVGDVAGAQKIIMAELTKQVGGSAKAQADGIAKTSVAWGNLKEAIGETLMSSSTGFDLAATLKDATKWIRAHKDDIVSVLQKIISVVFKVISIFLKWQSVVIKAFGYVIGAVAKVLDFMALLDPGMRDNAESAHRLADGFGAASQSADKASKWFNEASNQASTASKRAHDLSEALKQIKDKRVRVDVRTTINDVWTAVDEAVAAANAAAVPGLWTGGPVTPWQPTMVGELGPEVFMPMAGSPRVVGADGPELVQFATPGVVIPNHLVTAGATSTLTRERVVERGGMSLQVGTISVRDEREVVREMERMLARQARLDRERR